MALLDFGADVLTALSDALTRTRRRRYEHWVDISAPPEIVWSMLKARDLVFDGRIPIRMIASTVSGRPGVERVQIIAGKVRLEMMTRIVDERPGRAILYQLLPEGTDPELVEGEDDYVGFVLNDLGVKTRLDLTRETTPRTWVSRLTIPIGLRSGGARYKRKAEAMLGDAYSTPPEAGAG